MSEAMDSPFQRYLRERARSESGASSLDRAIPVTFFAGFSATTKREENVSLRGLMTALETTRAPAKAVLPWLKLARFGEQRTKHNSLRHDANVVEINGIEADYDGETITMERARTVLTNANIAAILYTSPSHTEAAPRWRVLCPTSKPLPPDDRAALVARINGLFVGALARESFTLSQAYYYGAVEGSEGHMVLAVEGRAIDLAHELDDHAVWPAKRAAAVPPPAPLLAAARPVLTDGASRLGRDALDERCSQIRTAPDGAKHAAINEAGFAIGGLVTRGHLEEGEAWAALRDALGAILHRCKDQRAAERTLRRAFEEGKARPQDVDPPEAEPPIPPAVWNITQRLRERFAPKAAPAATLAPELMDVPGALRMFIEHCDRTAISPQPFLALAAGITMVGALAGRRYRTSTDLRTNIYAVGVADSGAGKDHARKQIRRCLYAAGLPHYLGGSDVASGSGLRTALLRHPAMLFQIDEFGDWLADVLGERASSHRKQIAAMLKELYSSASIPWTGIEYADQSRQGRPREDIQQPHACLYGTTTPGQFWAAVSGANLHDGLLARMLLFVSPCSYPDEKDPDLAEPGPELVEALQAIAAGVSVEGGGNLAGLMSAVTAPEPYTVPETPAASAARRALRQDQLTQQRKHEGTYVTAIAGRLAENAMKLALVRAVSRDPARPVIEADDVAWGRALAQHCVDTLLREASQHVGDTDYERKVNRALEYIRKHGPISAREMYLKGWRLPQREREEIIRSIVEAGLAVAIEYPSPSGGGRPTIRYAASAGGNETSFVGADDAA